MTELIGEGATGRGGDFPASSVTQFVKPRTPDLSPYLPTPTLRRRRSDSEGQRIDPARRTTERVRSDGLEASSCTAFRTIMPGMVLPPDNTAAAVCGA